jgi:predicted nucleic acid-binding protein
VILVDTSVWIDHLRARDKTLVKLLLAEQVLGHPFIIGEIALGDMPQRLQVLNSLRDLPQAIMASQDEVLNLIERERLFGLGIGYVDAHLLAATRLTEGASLWTRDKRLRSAGESLALTWSTPA